MKPEIARALKEMKLDETFLIQKTTIPPIMEGKDVIGKAESGSGKTLAFSIPIIEKIRDERSIQALILTPTRELAEQVCNEIKKAGKYTKARAIAVYGGKSIMQQAQAFGRVNIVVATPGRLMDHIDRRNIDLRRVRILVLDEADRMFDMGFIDSINYILGYLPKERQTLLFSATLPERIKTIIHRYMKDPILIELNKEKPAVDTVRQTAFLVNEHGKEECLKFILNKKLDSALIFCATKRKADSLYYKLKNYSIGVMHGDLSQRQRDYAIDAFRNKRIKYLIATDVAARGIDVKNISHVINYDMPNDEETYVHRIGRTGRAGASGDSITFFTKEEIQDLLRIERFVRKEIEKKKFENGKVSDVNPADFSTRNVIIPKWDKGERFRRGGSQRDRGFRGPRRFQRDSRDRDRKDERPQRYGERSSRDRNRRFKYRRR